MDSVSDAARGKGWGVQFYSLPPQKNLPPGRQSRRASALLPPPRTFPLRVKGGLGLCFVRLGFALDLLEALAVLRERVDGVLELRDAGMVGLPGAWEKQNEWA